MYIIYEKTALYLAVENQNEHIVEYLLKKDDIDVNIKSIWIIIILNKI